jgi:hypothetical protein
MNNTAGFNKTKAGAIANMALWLILLLQVVRVCAYFLPRVLCVGGAS